MVVSTDLREKLIRIRRELHRRPELASEESETARLVCRHLDELDLVVSRRNRRPRRRRRDPRARRRPAGCSPGRAGRAPDPGGDRSGLLLRGSRRHARLRPRWAHDDAARGGGDAAQRGSSSAPRKARLSARRRARVGGAADDGGGRARGRGDDLRRPPGPALQDRDHRREPRCCERRHGCLPHRDPWAGRPWGASAREHGFRRDREPHGDGHPDARLA